MSGDYGEFLGRLSGVRRQRTGWLARCPAHDDRRASLSLWIADDTGDLMLRCHAGCHFQQVIDAVGVSKEALLADRGRQMNREVASYPYHDEQGNLLYEVVRFEPKDFRCRGANGEWGLGDTRRVLYRLPQILLETDRRVLLVEGEKAADRLVREGFLATCSPGGAGKWRQDYAPSLKGRDVILLPDNDAVGRSHMEAARRDLEGMASIVATLELGVPEKGDVVDWLDGGHTPDELKYLCREALHAERLIRELKALPKRDRWRALHATLSSLERE